MTKLSVVVPCDDEEAVIDRFDARTRAVLGRLSAAGVTVDAPVTGVDAPGCVTLVAIIAGLGGVQMVMPGLIGEYIGRISYETKRRPHFLVKEAHHPSSQAPEPLDALRHRRQRELRHGRVI
ncbi:hypothetical protein [Streptomyces sp. NPDC008317]|uniref:hypothetical protein n=1 Tax=Streptomyces sp. NPDC008317 TaxID=3364827 RepID=UPI0036E9F5C9